MASIDFLQRTTGSSYHELDAILSSRDISDDVGSDVSLNEFIHQLPKVLSEFEDDLKAQNVMSLFRRLKLEQKDWRQFVRFPDMSKNYTRNLVATDGKTFTLLMLYWNPNKVSPIHDHPCDGCWMRVCEGVVQEKRYKEADGDNGLICVQNDIFCEGEISHIADWMGYHKVGNPHISKPAVTLHLYSPPFESCNVWLNEKSTRSSRSKITYDTVYGTPKGHDWCI